MNKKAFNLKDFLINYGVILIIIILVAFTGIKSPNFLSPSNLLNLLLNMSARLVIALGIAGCVITAGCDLSAGRIIGLGGCLAGILLQKADYSGRFIQGGKPMNVFLAAIIVMLVCACFGAVTGSFIAFLSVPPFISTLAMMEIVYGLNLIVTNATPLGGYVTEYTNLASGRFLMIPYLVWIAILIGGISWFIFNMTRHGKYMYAIGANPQAAEVAGVPVKLTMVMIYAKAAAFYGLAGFMLGAKSGGASVNLGLGYEMEAIAACTIGGVSVTGGRGKVSSAVIGVAVFEFLKSWASTRTHSGSPLVSSSTSRSLWISESTWRRSNILLYRWNNRIDRRPALLEPVVFWAGFAEVEEGRRSLQTTPTNYKPSVTPGIAGAPAIVV